MKRLTTQRLSIYQEPVLDEVGTCVLNGFVPVMVELCVDLNTVC